MYYSGWKDPLREGVFMEGKMNLNAKNVKVRAAVVAWIAFLCVLLMSVVCRAAGGDSGLVTDETGYAYALATYAGVFSTSVVTSVNPTATLAILAILGSFENAAIYSPDSEVLNNVANFLNGVPIIREAGKLPISNPYAAVFLVILAAIFIVIHSTSVSELVAKKISLDKIDTVALNLSNVALSFLPLVTNDALAKDPPGVSLMVPPVILDAAAGPKWYSVILSLITLAAVTIFSNLVRACVSYAETIVAAIPIKGTSLIWQIIKAILHLILVLLMLFAPVICFIICVNLAVAAVFLFRILKRNSQYYKDVYVFTILRKIFKRKEPVLRVEKSFPRRLRRLYPTAEVAMSVYTFHGVARLAKRSRVWLIKDGDKVDIVYKRLIRHPYVISWLDLREKHGKAVYLEQCARFLRIRTEDRMLEMVMSNRYKPETEMLMELLDLKDFEPLKKEIKETKKANRKWFRKKTVEEAI